LGIAPANGSIVGLGAVAEREREREREREHVFGAFEITHHRPKERPDSVEVVHPKNGEEVWWLPFDDSGTRFPELRAELDTL
jgi:hypothetical protein